MKLRNIFAYALILGFCCSPLVSLAQEETGGDLELHIFYNPSCPRCLTLVELGQHFTQDHPEVTLESHKTNEPSGMDLFYELRGQSQVPAERWSNVTVVYLGERWTTKEGNNLIKAAHKMLQKTYDIHAQTWSDEARNVAGAARERFMKLEDFRNIGVGTMVVGGLLDGINPCAIATLIFLLSYLTFAGRSRNQILATGLSFCAGLFLTYLLIGLGYLAALRSSENWIWGPRILYTVMAVGTLILAIYTFRDYLKARAGAFGDMALRMPKQFTRLGHGVIRNMSSTPTSVLLALAAGILLALLEFACTGQIYLPALTSVWGMGLLRTQVLGLLSLYVLMFILPLLLITALAGVGVSSARLARWASEHTAKVKLATLVLFIVMTIYLVQAAATAFLMSA